MRYVCLGYLDERRLEAISQAERDAFIEACAAFDDVLRQSGHRIAGEALQGAENATTVRWHNGRLSIADGPCADRKESLGEVLVLEARDLNQAIHLMSQHPGVRLGGCFEVRPAERFPAGRANKSVREQG